MSAGAEIRRDSTELATVDHDEQMLAVMCNSLYPTAHLTSVQMVLDYCHAAGLDPLQKPVHIVPMWDKDARSMRDVVMPGIGLYRTQAARSGQLAGISEPKFGPDVTEKIGGADITYPQWCKVTVKRRLATGEVAQFTACERWKENYAIKGGKDRSIAPNAMWQKRPYGQLAKCAQAQALRTAFPEMTGAAPTADEMDGKALDADVALIPNAQVDDLMPRTVSDATTPSPDVVEGEIVAAQPEQVTGAEKASKPASQGAIGMVRIKAKAANVSESDVEAKFGLRSLDDADVDTVNRALAWLRAGAK